MILFKGKNKDCNIIDNLQKEFGVIIHPKSTIKVVEMLEGSNGFRHSKGSKPKQQIFQDGNTRTNLEKEVGKIES